MIDRPPGRIAREVNLMRDHALREQRIERLNRARRQMPRLVHRAGEEAAVKQMQNRMLHPADILVHVHPVGRILGIRRRFRTRGREPRVIPGRIHERIHGIRLAPRGRTTFRAGAFAPCGVAVQRVARNVERHIIGQFNRQVFLGLGHHTAAITMHHRNRAAPIALARNAPVAQAVFHLPLAQPTRLHPVN